MIVLSLPIMIVTTCLVYYLPVAHTDYSIRDII